MSITIAKAIFFIVGIVGFFILTRLISRRGITTTSRTEQLRREGLENQPTSSNWGLFKKVVGILGYVFSLVLACSPIFGSLWPTELHIRMENLNQPGAALGPIEIENTSVLFPIKILVGRCEIIEARYPGNNGVLNTDEVHEFTVGILPPQSISKHRCSGFNFGTYPIYLSKRVHFEYRYVGWPFTTREEVTEVLTWNHGEFSIGQSLE